jgi:hypothetical protein
VRHNAVRHGLLAKQVLFRQHETERNEFKHLLNDLERDYMPAGVVEKMLVEEIGATWWRIQIAARWELSGLRSQRQNSRRVVEEMKDLDHNLEILDCGLGHYHPAQWNCETLVIRSTNKETPAHLTAVLQKLWRPSRPRMSHPRIGRAEERKLKQPLRAPSQQFCVTKRL